jgi:Bacterial Ig-like domain (group 2)
MSQSNRRHGWTSARLALVATCVLAAGRAEAQLQITTPASGTVVLAGQTLSIMVNADPSVQGLGVIAEQPLPGIQGTSSPTAFTLAIPAGLTPGTYHLTAIGSLSGNLVESPPVAIDVERGDDPVLVRVEPTIIRFTSVGLKVPLRVIGTYADGSQATITGSSRTSYLSHDATVATVSAAGIVTAVAPGKTSVEVDTPAANYSIQVRVQAPPPTSLLLNNSRFKVDVQWTTSSGTGAGTAVQLTSDTGYFWFFSESNVEMVIKVLNACSLGGHYWVFAGGLTNVQTSIRVTDTQNGQVKHYGTAAGPPFAPIQDTSAFSTCP